MWSSLLLKRFGLTNLQKRSWLRTKLYPNEKESIVTSSRSTPGFDPRCKRHMSLRLFILAQTMCFSAGFPLSPPQKPLCVEEERLGGKKKKERARHDGKGKQRREAFSHLFPLPIVPWALSVFPLLLMLIGIPIGNLCGG